MYHLERVAKSNTNHTIPSLEKEKEGHAHKDSSMWILDRPEIIPKFLSNQSIVLQ